jgi:hypothetical protein
LAESDGYSDSIIEEAERLIGLRIPSPLREIYHTMGRNLVVDAQDPLLRPDRLSIDQHGMLVFRVENQQCAQWAVPSLCGEDPPVYYMNLQADSEGQWMPYHERLSIDLLEVIMMESMLSGKVSTIHSEIDRHTIEGVAGLKFLGIPRHPFWADPEGSVTWFGSPDAIVRDDAGLWLWASSPHESGLDAIRNSLEVEWQSLSE